MREQRERLDLDPVEVARRLVAELTERREARHILQTDVVRRLSEEAGDPIDGGDEIRGTRVSNWEAMRREPRIDEFAAWARAVDMRLVVELEPAESERRAVMIHPDRAELAKLVDKLSTTKLASAETILDWMLSKSSSEVENLAEYLAKQLRDDE